MLFWLVAQDEATLYLGLLLNIDNRDNRLGATTILIIDIYFFFSIIIDML